MSKSSPPTETVGHAVLGGDTDDEETVLLTVRLDKRGVDLSENEVYVDGPLFVSDETEADLLDALDPRGDPRE